MLQPWGKGLLGTTLRYPYEVRDEEIFFDGIREVKIPKDMLVLAVPRPVLWTNGWLMRRA
jgi:DNA end-binding protein Ku